MFYLHIKNALYCHSQAVFRRKRFQSTMKPFPSGYKLEDYIIGNQIGKGSNAVVYEAAPQCSTLKDKDSNCSLVQLREDEGEGERTRSVMCCSLRNFPLAIKMLWNFGVGFICFCFFVTTFQLKKVG